MKLSFKLEFISFNKINQLPNSWNTDDFRKLLDIMEYGDTGDISEFELKDMCYMLLADNEPEEAAAIILEYVFKERLNKRQIENISNEMQDEKMWEEYADLSLHEEFFNANQILYGAFNGKFPNPEAVQFSIKVSAKQASDLSIFKGSCEAPLIRLIVSGMPKTTLINRLFDEQLAGNSFKDAKDIIWQLKQENIDDKTIKFDIISSYYWFKDLKYVNDFVADTHSEE